MTPLAEGGVRSLVKRLDTVPSLLAVFRRLTQGGRRPHTVLLESAEPSSRQTQKSLLVLSSALEIICRGPSVMVRALNSNGRSVLPFLQQELATFTPQLSRDELCLMVSKVIGLSDEQERLHAPSVLTVLRTIAQALTPETSDLPEAVFLAGIFAYDLVEQFEPLPEPNSGDSFPDFLFYLADQLLVIDHLAQRAFVVVNVFGGEFAGANYYSAVQTVTAISDAASEVKVEDPLPTIGSGAADSLAAVHVDHSDEEFERTVQALQQHIVVGDVFQIVPSRTFSLPCADPFLSYESLRTLNPSPYLFYVNAGDFVLFGASPESAVKVDGHSRQVEISPIAGTRPRGLHPDGSVNPDLDSRLEVELRLDTKENAEHMMLVDLARNDVARVSKPGTRFVAELLRVGRYSHVMHLVSRVCGELRDGLDALHAYQASMNMGTLTGAPKICAMQLLRKYELGRRGPYGGAVGYLRGDGSFDTAIVIRSALVKDGVARVRAGAGVVYDSVPALEADETRRKAEAVLRAIARANRQSATPSAGSDHGR